MLSRRCRAGLAPAPLALLLHDEPRRRLVEHRRTASVA